MLPFFISNLLAFLFFALSVSATRSVTVKTTGPESVSHLKDLVVKVTLTNTGDQTLKLLKDPRGALSPFPGNSFGITKEDGCHPKFIGAKSKYAKQYIAANGTDESFVILHPGHKYSVDHSLSKAYNFSTCGTGKYSFEAHPHFYAVDKTHAIIPIVATETIPTTIELTGDLMPPVRGHLHRRGAGFTGCTAQEKDIIKKAAAAAQVYAVNTYHYLQNNTKPTPRYTTWFGNWTTKRHSTVVSSFSHIQGYPFSKYWFDCTCQDPESYAYVYPDHYSKVYICPAFWDAPVTGEDSQAGTLIHESSHFIVNGGTDDHAYGQDACKELAKTNPDYAVENADSHEYMAENAPALK